MRTFEGTPTSNPSDLKWIPEETESTLESTADLMAKLLHVPKDEAEEVHRKH